MPQVGHVVAAGKCLLTLLLVFRTQRDWLGVFSSKQEVSNLALENLDILNTSKQSEFNYFDRVCVFINKP